MKVLMNVYIYLGSIWVITVGFAIRVSGSQLES
jgi:hypothetical protein